MRTCQRVSTLFRRVPTAFITRLSVAEAAAKIFVVVEIPVLEEVVSLATKRNLYDCTDCTDCTDCIRASFLEAATAQSLKYVNGMEREKSKEKHESRTILENVENERKFQKLSMCLSRSVTCSLVVLIFPLHCGLRLKNQTDNSIQNYISRKLEQRELA